MVRLGRREQLMRRARGTPAIGTSEARKALPELVRRAVGNKRPAASLKKNAVEIQPRGEERSASLVPTIDLDAAEAEIEELKEDLENAGIALFVLDRLNRTERRRLSEDEFLAEIGMTDYAEGLTDP
jgi:hypothetical protein